MRSKLPKGNGMYIWQLKSCEGGNLTKIVERAKNIGLGHVLVKFADGREAFQHDLVKKFVPLAQAAGIEAWGWPYIYGHSPSGEAEIEAQWYKDFKFDGFVIDAEQEYKNNKSSATQYATTLRSKLPDTPIGLSSYWWPSMHSEFPWDDFMAQCDFVMPQVYWSSSKRDPVDCLNKSVTEFNHWGKPIIPTGGDFSDANFTADDMLRFFNRAIELDIKGMNWWSWQATKPEFWDAIKMMKYKEDKPVDNTDVSDWAYEAWAWAKDKKLMDGTDPQKPMTREMFAVILKRFDAMIYAKPTNSGTPTPQ